MREDENKLQDGIEKYTFSVGDIVKFRPREEIEALFPGYVSETFLSSPNYLKNADAVLTVKKVGDLDGFYDVGWGVGVNGNVLIPATEPVTVTEDEVLDLMFK